MLINSRTLYNKANTRKRRNTDRYRYTRKPTVFLILYNKANTRKTINTDKYRYTRKPTVFLIPQDNQLIWYTTNWRRKAKKYNYDSTFSDRILNIRHHLRNYAFLHTSKRSDFRTKKKRFCNHEGGSNFRTKTK